MTLNLAQTVLVPLWLISLISFRWPEIILFWNSWWLWTNSSWNVLPKPWFISSWKIEPRTWCWEFGSKFQLNIEIDEVGIVIGISTCSYWIHNIFIIITSLQIWIYWIHFNLKRRTHRASSSNYRRYIVIKLGILKTSRN